MQTKNEAIAAYLKSASKVHGIGAVILLPEFTGSDDSGWIPEGNGIRGTKKEGTSFIRLGAVVLGDGLKTTVRFTNDFMPTTELTETFDMLSVTPGGKVPGKLIAHERLEAFRRTNSDQDIKWADKTAGLPCLVEDQPIYRRIEHTMNLNKSDMLVQHTNTQALSENARTKWELNNAKSASTTIADAGKRSLRITELKAIAKAKRTPAEVAELADLLEA